MMTKFEYNDDNQTIVGSKKKQLMDLETKEIIEVDQIVKRTYGTKHFWKIYLMDFLNILGILDNKQLDVLIYILENTQEYTNMFIGTYAKIQKETKISRPTIATIMVKLQEHDFLTKVQNGVWRINPNIMMKGNDQKRKILVSYYQENMK